MHIAKGRIVDQDLLNYVVLNILMDKNHYNLKSVYGISIIIALSAIVASSYLPFANIASAQQQQQQNVSSRTNTNNNATVATPSSSSSGGGKPPTDGYSTPGGHLTAIRHVFDDS